MTGPAELLESSLADEIAANQAACQRLLETGFANLRGAIPSLPGSAPACFDFLSRIGLRTRALPQFAEWIARARQAGIAEPFVVERYLVLQACTVALSRLQDLQADESVKRQWCATCKLLTLPGIEQDQRLDHRSDAFGELAQLVTLRRFHAGQLSFDIMRLSVGSLLWWTLSVHPLDAPRWVYELIAGPWMFGAVVSPHVCYWRARPGFFLPKEQLRSFSRIAKTIALYPRLRGLVACSWLYSPDVGAESPHLAWTRDFFVQRGAFIVGIGPADESDGFLVGSERRRRLYAEGKFCPELTCVLWRRSDLLTWAEACERGESVGYSSPNAGEKVLRRWEIEEGRPYVWSRSRRFLFRRPKTYAAVVLLLPGLAVACAIAALANPLVAVLSVPLTMILMWVLQYYVLIRR